MTYLTKEDLLTLELKREEVYLSELDKTVIVQEMSADDRDVLELSMFEHSTDKEGPDLVNMRAKMIALCCIDEEGNRLFSFDDAKKLGTVSGAVAQTIFGVAQKLSRTTKKDLEELVQDLRNVQAEDSSSD